MNIKRQPSVNQLVNRFDNELKKLLLKDLQAIKNVKSNLLNTIQNKMDNKQNLSAA